MGENMDILYYDIMIENAVEERRVNELIMMPRFAKYVCEGADEVAIIESNVLKTIGESIKNLFQKVIEFFKKILNKILNKEICKPKMELVKACEERIKSFTEADKRQFIIKDADITKTIEKGVNLHTVLFSKSFTALNQIIEKFNTYVNGKQKTDPSYFEKTLDGIALLNEQLDKVAELETLKKNGDDVTFGSISEILKNYRIGTEITSTLKEELQKLDE